MLIVGAVALLLDLIFAALSWCNSSAPSSLRDDEEVNCNMDSMGAQEAKAYCVEL